MWTIEAIALYRFAVPGPEVLFQRAFGETIPMVIYAFLLRRGGEMLLVDCGLPEDFRVLDDAVAARKGDAARFRPAGPSLGEALRERGVSPDAILLTSFGPYAAGGLAQLPAVPVFASARGLADLATPEEAALVHALPPATTSLLQRATPIRGEGEVRPGLTLVETGIHHPASAAVVAETGEGRVAIADPVFTARNLEEGVALGAAENAAGWHGMVRRLGRRADAILPIHDVNPTALARSSWHPSLQRNSWT